jgi:phosphopentomutase
MKDNGKDLGVRKGFCDVAASIADWLSVDYRGPGSSFIKENKSESAAASI